MTHHGIDLALAFLQSQPGSAAAILERQPVDQVAAFLKDVPSKQAAVVLGKILPQYTARICQALEPSKAVGFLKELDMNLVAAILRQSSAETRNKLLDAIPEKIKISCKLLLHYAEESVGAWMVTHINSLPVDCTVDEALSRLVSEMDLKDIHTIPVVDRERKLQGMVELVSLLRAKQKTPITEIMEKVSDSISGRTALVSAKKHPVWTRGDVLAVKNRQHHFVGILRHVDLRRGLDQIAKTITRPPASVPINDILATYGNTLLIFFASVVELAGADNPVGK